MPVSISGAGSISGLDQGFNVTTGSVGIGTDNPSAPLHLSGPDAANAKIKIEDNNNGFAASEIGVENGGRDLKIAAPQDIYFEDVNTGVRHLYIESGGNIGIGTDNPGSNKLQVQGSSAFYGNGGASATWGDTSYLGALSFDGSAQPVIRAASSKALIFQVNQSTEALRITSAGNIGIGVANPTQKFMVKGIIASEATNSTNNWMAYTYTDNTFRLNYNGAGADEVVITSGGAFGIGANNPDTLLHVRSSDNVLAKFESTDADALIEFKDSSTTDTILMGALGGDDLLLRCDAGNIIFKTANNTEKLRITSDGRLCINATSPAIIGGQTPYLYVSSYTNLDGLRIRGLDTGNTIWKDGGDMSLTVASNDAINLKTNGTTRFVLNANSNNSTTLSIGNGSNLNNNTSPDRTSVKVGGTLHLEAPFAGSNHKTGMYYNCSASGQGNYYQGTFAASSHDYRAAAATMNHGAFKVYTDPTTSTNYSAGAQITTMKETLTCSNGFVTAPNQPCFFATSNTGGAHTSNGYTGIISNQLEAAYVNVGNHFNTSTGVFTCPVAGVYEFHGQGLIRWQTGAGRAELSFYKNGSNTITRSYGYTYVTGSPDHDNLHVMGYITCAVNDQIDLRVYAMDSGVDCYWGQGLGYFAGRLVQ